MAPEVAGSNPVFHPLFEMKMGYYEGLNTGTMQKLRYLDAFFNGLTLYQVVINVSSELDRPL